MADEVDTMMTAGEDGIASLPHLQNLIKRDPDAYQAEFARQYEHFQSMLELFRQKPQKAAKKFHELVMFLAHVVPCYENEDRDYPQILMTILKEHYNVLHPSTRKTLVQALVFLRNRKAFDLVKVLPIYFKLFKLQDKSLRASLLSHMVLDIQRSQKAEPGRDQGEVQKFFFGQIRNNDFEVGRKAVAVIIVLCQKKIWFNEKVVNQVSAALMCPDIKTASGSCNFFLGNKQAMARELMSESESSDEEELKKQVKKTVIGAKKTRGKVKQIKRKNKVTKKLLEKKKGKKLGSDLPGDFAAVDALHDPHALVEKLLARVSKTGEPYQFRLLLLQLLARIVGRHHIIVLNLYPLLQRYMQPHQKQVSTILACFAQASHAFVPPEELNKVITHLIHNFVSESCPNEVIAIGMNTIREVCTRSPFAIKEDQLADLVEFRKNKDKGVMMASKALMNLYRDQNPEMLQRGLRGREASMALQRGLANKPVYGIDGSSVTGIAGLELLAQAKAKKGLAMDAEIGENVSDSEEEVEITEAEFAQLVADGVANPEDAVSVSDSEEKEGGSDDEEAEEGDGSDAGSDDEELAGSDFEIDSDAEVMSDAEVDEDEDSAENSAESPAPASEGAETSLTAGSKPRRVKLPKVALAKARELKKAKKLAKRGKVVGEVAETKVSTEQKQADSDAIKAAQSMLMDQVLSADDFKALRKLNMAKSVEMQLGRKRRADEKDLYNFDDESEEEKGESDEEKDKEESADEKAITADSLKLFIKDKKLNNKQNRIAAIKAGRGEKETFEEKVRKRRKGGKTNIEKARGKAHGMVLHKKKRRHMISVENKCNSLRKAVKAFKGKQSKKLKNKRRRC